MWLNPLIETPPSVSTTKAGGSNYSLLCVWQPETVSGWNRKWANQSCWVKCFFFFFSLLFFFFSFLFFFFPFIHNCKRFATSADTTGRHSLTRNVPFRANYDKGPLQVFFFFYKVMMRGVQIVPWRTGHQKCRGNGFWILFFLRSLAGKGLVFM